MSPRLILAAMLSAGLLAATASSARAEFFGCNTPKVTRYTTGHSSSYYRAGGSRSGQHGYAAAQRHSSRTAYSARQSYRAHW
jgi:hypothetical protein